MITFHTFVYEILDLINFCEQISAETIYIKTHSQAAASTYRTYTIIWTVLTASFLTRHHRQESHSSEASPFLVSTDTITVITDNDGQMNITVLPNTEKMRQTIENSKEEEEKCWKMTVSIMGQISINYELMTESEIQTLPCKKQMASEDAIRPQ